MNKHKLVIKYSDGSYEDLDCSRWEFGKGEMVIYRFCGNNVEETLYFVPLTNIRFVIDEMMGV